jgi:hypothetical protein
MVAALAVLGLLALVVACGSGGRAAEPTPTPELRLATSCGVTEEITSYRYTLRFQIDGPSLSLNGDAGEAAALEQFAQTLVGLLSDMQIEGAFVAPDRSQAILRFQGQEVELRTIGDKSWKRLGNVWQEEADVPVNVTISPTTICSEILPDLEQSLSGSTATPETVNGVATLRYQVDGADLTRIERLFGEKTDKSSLPKRFTGDIWLAEESGWPVKLRLSAMGNDEDGESGTLNLDIEFRSINSADIEIAPPKT